MSVFVALLVPVMLIFTALAVDLSTWYVHMQRLQKTVDAAALAAAPFMPEALSGTDKASMAAKKLITANGMDPATATIQQGARPSQVRVTMSSTVRNAFASLIGLNTTTITRTAVGEFSGPAPMGSPCNVHGNEPWVSGPFQGSALPDSSPPANCTTYPQFWSTIVGPEIYKTQGDQFAARKCGEDPYQESGCLTPGTGGANGDYDPRGYVIAIKVREPLSGDLAVQLYDPAYVDTGTAASRFPSITDDTPNSYVDDATERYRRDPKAISADKPSYCTGDDDSTVTGPCDSVPRRRPSPRSESSSPRTR